MLTIFSIVLLPIFGAQWYFYVIWGIFWLLDNSEIVKG